MLLESLAILHAAIYVSAAACCFGGNAWWVEMPLIAFGALSFPLCAITLYYRHIHDLSAKPLIFLIPLILLNAYVAISYFNPNHRVLFAGDSTFYVKGGDIGFLPSAAVPSLVWARLLWFDTAFLTGYNLLIAVRRKSRLAQLAVILSMAGLILSVVGTIQRLLACKGPFFGAVVSPNPFFFSTFLYHNHWASFAVLLSALCLGCCWYYIHKRGSTYRDFWHSPGSLLLVCFLLLAVSAPLSSSRSGTIMAMILVLISFSHWLFKKVARPRYDGRSGLQTAIAACAALLCVVVLIAWFAKPVFQPRIRLTQAQVSEIVATQSMGDRAQLYRDTLRMIEDKPTFGWGMGSYPHVFFTYSTLHSKIDRLPTFYADAHSDWLQSIAELGIVGSLLIALHALLPFVVVMRHCRSLPLFSFFALLGCSLVLLYAMIEFPFGCPAIVVTWWVLFFMAMRFNQLHSGKMFTPEHHESAPSSPAS